MTTRLALASLLAATLFLLVPTAPRAPACCPAPPLNKPVVNADQTVILLWDPATKTEHFIRQASFKSGADDFGFLVPTPAQPELAESGNDAFPYLLKLTEPEKQKQPRPSNIGCCIGCASAVTGPPPDLAKGGVKVLDEKLVAGFNAVVLEASAADALTRWLADHGYAFSPEVEAWAKPYVEAGWKITALKVAKDRAAEDKKTVTASALRLSFKTDRPLFPYREPDPRRYAQSLGAKKRLLRIYFIADARYRGQLQQGEWATSKVAWAGKLRPEDRTKLLELLRLPPDTGPADWWLTEFEDDWPYQAAPSDIDFVRGADQRPVKRPPHIEYVALPIPTDLTVYALAVALIVPPLVRRVRRRAA
jgi:hypothetical protein